MSIVLGTKTSLGPAARLAAATLSAMGLPHRRKALHVEHATAMVLGASGSVGNALVKELIRDGSFKPIVTLVRRSQPDQVAMARDAAV